VAERSVVLGPGYILRNDDQYCHYTAECRMVGSGSAQWLMARANCVHPNVAPQRYDVFAADYAVIVEEYRRGLCPKCANGGD